MLKLSSDSPAISTPIDRPTLAICPVSPTDGTALTALSARRVAHRSSQANRDRQPDGGNSLKRATSAYPFLQFFAPPPSPILRDTVSKTDVDYYKFFDKRRPNNFQAEGLILGFNFRNRSNANLSFDFLNRAGIAIRDLSRTVAPGQTFVSQQGVDNRAFYLRVRTTATGKNRYEVALPVINS